MAQKRPASVPPSTRSHNVYSRTEAARLTRLSDLQPKSQSWQRVISPPIISWHHPLAVERIEQTRYRTNFHRCMSTQWPIRTGTAVEQLLSIHMVFGMALL